MPVKPQYFGIIMHNIYFSVIKNINEDKKISYIVFTHLKYTLYVCRLENMMVSHLKLESTIYWIVGTKFVR